jgi:hypothetical protein
LLWLISFILNSQVASPNRTNQKPVRREDTEKTWRRVDLCQKILIERPAYQALCEPSQPVQTKELVICRADPGCKSNAKRSRRRGAPAAPLRQDA